MKELKDLCLAVLAMLMIFGIWAIPYFLIAVIFKLVFNW